MKSQRHSSTTVAAVALAFPLLLFTFVFGVEGVTTGTILKSNLRRSPAAVERNEKVQHDISNHNEPVLEGTVDAMMALIKQRRLQDDPNEDSESSLEESMSSDSFSEDSVSDESAESTSEESVESTSEEGEGSPLVGGGAPIGRSQGVPSEEGQGKGPGRPPEGENRGQGKGRGKRRGPQFGRDKANEKRGGIFGKQWERLEDHPQASKKKENMCKKAMRIVAKLRSQLEEGGSEMDQGMIKKQEKIDQLTAGVEENCQDFTTTTTTTATVSTEVTPS